MQSHNYKTNLINLGSEGVSSGSERTENNMHKKSHLSLTGSRRAVFLERKFQVMGSRRLIQPYSFYF